MQSALALAERRDLLLPRGVYQVDAPLHRACFLLITRCGACHVQWLTPDARGDLPEGVDEGLAAMLDAIDPVPKRVPPVPNETRVLSLAQFRSLRAAGLLTALDLPQ